MQNTKARCKQAAQQSVDDKKPQPGRGCSSKPPMLPLRPAAAASARVGLPAALEACSRSSQSQQQNRHGWQRRACAGFRFLRRHITPASLCLQCGFCMSSLCSRAAGQTGAGARAPCMGGGSAEACEGPGGGSPGPCVRRAVAVLPRCAKPYISPPDGLPPPADQLRHLAQTAMENTKAQCKQAAHQCVDDKSPEPGRGCISKPPMLLLRPAAAASARVGLPAPLEACGRSSHSPAARSAWMAAKRLCRIQLSSGA